MTGVTTRYDADQETIRVSKWLIGVLSGIVVVLVGATFSGVWWASTLTQKMEVVSVMQSKMEANIQALANSANGNDTSVKLISQSLNTLQQRIETIASRQTINEERIRLLEVRASKPN